MRRVVNRWWEENKWIQNVWECMSNWWGGVEEKRRRCNVRGWLVKGRRGYGEKYKRGSKCGGWVSACRVLSLVSRAGLEAELPELPTSSLMRLSGYQPRIPTFPVAQQYPFYPLSYMTMSTTSKSLFNSTLCNLFYFLRAAHISTVW